MFDGGWSPGGCRSDTGVVWLPPTPALCVVAAMVTTQGDM